MAKIEYDDSKAMVKFEEKYPALAGGGAVAAAISANLAGSKMSAFDLDRIKVPSGGGIAWEIPDGNGGINISKSIEGIIVFMQHGRDYWKVSIKDGGGGTPPDCTSADGVTGVGEPGGNCESCMLSKYGSAEGGKGQACKQHQTLFILREGDVLPSVLIAPPTSLGPLRRDVFINLAKRAKVYNQAVVRLELIKTKNAAGTEYAEIKGSIIRDLTPEESAAVNFYSTKTAESFASYQSNDVE